MAAGFLLAILCGSWLASPSKHPSVRGSKDSMAAGNDAIDKLPTARQDTGPQDTGPQVSGALSIIAAPGYLAAKLSDDPEFEIFIVRPTRKTSETN